MTQWEYQILTLDDFYSRRSNHQEIMERLATLGHQGWEIAGTTTPTNSHAVTVFLKRPLPRA